MAVLPRIFRADVFFRLYIKESPRPDCDPDRRFRATLPDGTMAYARTHVEAENILCDLFRESR